MKNRLDYFINSNKSMLFVKQTFLMALVFFAPYGSNIIGYILIPYALVVVINDYFLKKNFIINQRRVLIFLLVVSPLLIHVISLSYTDNIYNCLQLIEQNLIFLFLPLIFVFRKQICEFKTVSVSNTFVVSILLALLYIYLNLVFLLHENHDSFSDIFRWKYSYTNLTSILPVAVNYFAFYAFIALPLIYYICKWNNKIKIISFIFIGFSIIHMNSRTSVLLLMILLAIIFYNELKLNIYIKVIISLSLLIGIFSISYQMNYLRERFPIEINNGEIVIKEKRINRWGAVWTTFIKSDNYLLGYGSGSVKPALIKEYKSMSLEIAASNKYNAHNQYLQYLVENGILGLGIFLFVVFYTFHVVIKKRYKVLLICLLSFLFFSLTESTLKRQKGIIFLAFVLTASHVKYLNNNDQSIA